MLSLEKARLILTQEAAPLAPIEVGLAAALGLRLAASQPALHDLPPEDVSTMDGYALRVADLARQPLPIAATIRAGDPAHEFSPGTAARIQTGAVIPRGADCVIPQEQTVTESDGRLRFIDPQAASTTRSGACIRRRGEIRCTGQPLAELGDSITPQLIGLLAAAGRADVQVIPRPRLAIVTTGSELIGLHQRPGEGKIRDSNARMLRALADFAALPVHAYERIPDTKEQLSQAVSAAAACADLVVTSGGVSVGDFDLVRNVIEERGGSILFHRLAIRPGKPTLAGRIGSTWLIGLPGNPLSALVGWHLLVRPLAEQLAGDPKAFDDAREIGVLLDAVSNTGDRVTFHPAIVSDLPDSPTPKSCSKSVRLIPWKGSHDLFAISQANALAVLDSGKRFSAGDSVSYLPV